MKIRQLYLSSICATKPIKADKLRKLIAEDMDFPRPIKDGKTRQAAVYFDLNAIENWWKNKYEKL
ncbi:AlpA family transcriptional regulator [Acinetobacter pittii]